MTGNDAGHDPFESSRLFDPGQASAPRGAHPDPYARDPFDSSGTPGPPWQARREPDPVYGPSPTRAAPLPRSTDVRPVRSPAPGNRVARRLMLAAAVAALLVGLFGFLTLDSVSILSIDPFGDATGWILLLVIASCAAFAVFVWSVVCLITTIVRHRPKALPALAVFVAAVLPACAVTLAVTYGLHAALHRAATDGGAIAGFLERVLDSWGIGGGPIGDLLKKLAS